MIFSAIIGLYLFFFLSCFCISHVIFNTITEREKALRIFVVSSFSYFLFALFAYWAYLTNNNSFFQYPDQENFYAMSQYLGGLFSVKSIFNACFIDPADIILTENQGAYFYLGSISYFANHYLGGNNVLFQILNVSFLAALIPVFVFRILTYFVSLKSAFRASIVFVFCSYVFYYSPWILRDIHIALLYVIGLSILFSPFKVYRLIILSVLVFITTFFRMEHGLFMLFMPLLYIYEQTKYNKIIHYVFIIIALGVCMTLSAVIIPEIIAIQAGLDRYIDYTQAAAEDGGLGKYILHLPMGIRQIASMLFSQFSPFPSWNLAINARNIPQFVIGLIQMTAPAFWFMVWFCVIQIISFKDYRKLLPNILIFSGLAFIVFLLANSSNMNPRRLICMYPVLYLFFVIAKEKYPFYIKKNMKRGFMAYLVLCLVYLIIK
ncbi:hypothetical protein [Bacteroides salyersiae]|uniref:hypothetical protein n=1 Tax=Bacteroides salyersiae TaxID=291644 RepID=UPI001C8C2999|nr:hypothetical protein [Bacteroides salyersiae]